MKMLSACHNAEIQEITDNIEGEQELIGLKCSVCNEYLLNSEIIEIMEEGDKLFFSGCRVYMYNFGPVWHYSPFCNSKNHDQKKRLN